MSLFRSQGASGEPTGTGGASWSYGQPDWPDGGRHRSADGGRDAHPPEALQPLANELIMAVLDARGYKYFIDSDGDIGGHWDNNLFYFFRLGQQQEMFQVRATARRTFTVDDVPRLYAFCNSWNHDKLWPKAYVHVSDDGTVGVFGEVTTDLEQGVTSAQLDQLVACGISTGCALAEAVDELPG